MEEINLKDLYKYFISKLPIIIIITLAVTLLGVCYSLFLQVPKYQSSTTLLLTQSIENSDSSITQSDIALNQKLVNTYSEIIKSKKIMKQVIGDLELDYSYGELISKVSIQAVSDTEIIRITVTDEDSELAKDIANSLADNFSEEIVKIYNIRNLSIIDAAEVSTTPSNVNAVKQTVLCLLIGLVLSCGVVFIIYYFDNTVKSSEEIEEKIKLPVLGSIPAVHSRNNTKKKVQ